jgi:class 3 adenylate cyclase
MDTLTTDNRFQVLQASGAFPKPALERFAEFIRSSDEEEIYRMSPLRCAKKLDIPERTAVDLFLHATHVGILDFSWGVLCPLCASFIVTTGGLRTLREAKRCNFCQIDIKCELDDNIEVAFTVSPSVRRIRFHEPETVDIARDGFRLFFSPSLPAGGMFHKTLHQALVQSGRLPAQEVREVKIALAPGRYLLMTPENHGVMHFTAVPGSAGQTMELDLLDGCWIPDHCRVPAGESTLKIRNKTKRAEGFLLLPDPIPPPEDRPGDPVHPDLNLRPFLTGKNLICTQAFRDLFRAESIPSEGGLDLKNLTVLFTDLKGSTELYERIGDLRAYDLVRRHFTTLHQISARQGGSVVKTIGDAIMATFPEPESGFQAAVDMNREIAGVSGADLRLKIGLHCGSCIAVELNERLDYFGRTVNIASRVQNLAEAREIVCTDPVFGSPGIERIILEAGLTTREDRASLKGIAGDTRIYRVR